MNNFKDWQILKEYADTSRYSVEVNFKTKPEEVLEAYAKISLGYVSSAIKKLGFHTKHVYTENPVRLMVSTGGWEDGEDIVIVSWDKTNKCFALSTGFYKKNKRTVGINKTLKCQGDDAGEVYKELFNKLQELKKEPNKNKE